MTLLDVIQQEERKVLSDLVATREEKLKNWQKVRCASACPPIIRPQLFLPFGLWSLFLSLLSFYFKISK